VHPQCILGLGPSLEVFQPARPRVDEQNEGCRYKGCAEAMDLWCYRAVQDCDHFSPESLNESWESLAILVTINLAMYQTSKYVIKLIQENTILNINKYLKLLCFYTFIKLKMQYF